MLTSKNRMLYLVVACSLFLTAIGCAKNDGKSMIADANDSNVKRLATMYSFFHLRNQFKGPKNEDELREFIEAQDPSRLSLANIDASKMDELFTGERDGEQFTIRYGIDTVIRGPALPVVFETTGVDGKRQVGFCNGSMQEVDADEYDRLMKGGADSDKVDDGRE